MERLTIFSPVFHSTVCPVTCGRETKMTEAGFKKACLRFSKKPKAGALGLVATNKLTAKFCKACKRTPPAELTIITI